MVITVSTMCGTWQILFPYFLDKCISPTSVPLKSHLKILYLTKGNREKERAEKQGRSTSARKEEEEACRGSRLKKKKGKQMKGGKRERTAKKEGRKKRKKNKA